MRRIFDWFLARYITFTEKDRDAARKLLSAGRRQAMTGSKPLCAHHPALRQLADGPHKGPYEYYYTVAFAVMGMLGASMYFPPDKRRSTTEAIKAELESWRRDSYSSDAHHLLSKLNITSARAESIVGTWLVEQVARKAGEAAETERIRALKEDEGLINALGNDILTQAAEAVVACCLADKNK